MLFPAPATRGKSISLYKAEGLETTDVSHVSIEENSVRITSIPRRYHLEGTTLRSPCSVIHRQFCDLSMDLAEKANLEGLVAICHLQDNLSDPSQQSQH